MQIFTQRTDPRLVATLRAGGVAVVRTDTLYGLIASADNRRAVERIYDIKGRTENKPFIILISSLDMLYDFASPVERKYIDKVWPGKVSIILQSLSAPEWLRRGGDTLAYRLPADPELRKLIDHTGPLVAPSANPQGESPALSIQQAIEYFGEAVDAYVDSGEIVGLSLPSQLMSISKHGEVKRLR